MRIRLMSAACLTAILAIPAAANAAVKQHPKPKKSHVTSVKHNPRRCGERGGWEFNLNIKPYHVFVCNGAPGAIGPAGPAGANGQNAATGTQGSIGVTGAPGSNANPGPAGVAGQNGQGGAQGLQGPQGPAGPTGASAPFTYTYAGNTALDSGYCGDDWANDSFDSEYTITPLADGSYLVVKYLTGSFTTIAGAHAPSDCSAIETGGVNGTFSGVETWTIPATGGMAANFDPTADPNLNHYTSGEAQNRDFTSAFFPGATYAGETNFDLVYHAGSQTWVDSNTPANNTGNITG